MIPTISANALMVGIIVKKTINSPLPAHNLASSLQMEDKFGRRSQTSFRFV